MPSNVITWEEEDEDSFTVQHALPRSAILTCKSDSLNTSRWGWSSLRIGSVGTFFFVGDDDDFVVVDVVCCCWLVLFSVLWWCGEEVVSSCVLFFCCCSMVCELLVLLTLFVLHLLSLRDELLLAHWSFWSIWLINSSKKIECWYF